MKITPFQDAHVGLEPYRPEAAPIFKTVFDPPPEFPQLGALARPCEEADVALLLDNPRDKPVSAIHYTWTQTFQSGYSSTRSLFSYGYRVEECRAVIGSRKRLLVTPETSVSESLLEQVLADNSGLLGSGGPPIVHWHEAVEWRFELLALIFEDGEMVGPAAERLADRIQCELRPSTSMQSCASRTMRD